MGDDVFANCTNLKRVTVNDKITYIPRGLFFGCPNLILVHFGNKIESIGISAF